MLHTGVGYTATDSERESRNFRLIYTNIISIAFSWIICLWHVIYVCLWATFLEFSTQWKPWTLCHYVILMSFVTWWRDHELNDVLRAQCTEDHRDAPPAESMATTEHNARRRFTAFVQWEWKDFERGTNQFTLDCLTRVVPDELCICNVVPLASCLA